MGKKAPPFGGKQDKEKGMKEGSKADKKADAKQGKMPPSFASLKRARK